MGKNHRHKKNVKADKAKIKLKQTKTKFLPKGLNETKATFKIKPIVLPQQLRERSTDTLLSKRKLNIDDLQSRLSHYNENVRHSACEELADMYKQHSENIMREHLHPIIAAISSLMRDKERKVRKAAVKAITVILEVTPHEKLETFFKYFSLNLCCAMTDIDENTQEDSLNFLDCFLLKDCGLISKSFDSILPHFISLISRLRSESSLGRTLTINLGRKMTSVTWRIKVLSRLHAILNLVLKKNDSHTKRNVEYIADSSNTFPIYKVSLYKALENSHWDSFQNNAASKNVTHTHLSALIPMFYEIWMEVLPEKKSATKAVFEPTNLSEESTAVLSSLVNSMYLLWKFVETAQTAELDLKNIFASTEATEFLNHLLANFPYCQSEGIKNRSMPKSNPLSLNVTNDPNCVKENIIICYIYFVVNANFHGTGSNNELERVGVYLKMCLTKNNYVNQNNVQYVIEFIRLCLLEQCHIWKKSKIDARHILKNVISLYETGSIGRRNKMEIFKILTGLVHNPFLSKSIDYHSWLSSLPKLLCGSQITDVTVATLLQLARENVIPFLDAVRENMSQILKNLNSLEISLTNSRYKDQYIIKREIIYIFYYLKDVSCIELQTILQCLTEQNYQQDRRIIKIDGKYLTRRRFADDNALISSKEEKLEELIKELPFHNN